MGASMEDVQQPELDWTNLPADASEESLWDSLHDARLIDISSDRLERTVRLEFKIRHLRDFHKLAENITFALHFRGVQSARVSQSVVWPGQFDVPAGASREEESQLIADYQAKWREESISWTEFESKITVGGNTADVYDAVYAIAADGPFAIKLVLGCDDGTYPQLFLRSESIEIHTSDGEPLSFVQFLRLGADYWEAFAARRRTKILQSEKA
jgi:hypothetical protein